jgi:sarcosine oxidase subunit alpha
MFRRARPLEAPVSLTLDGRDVQAERGEPIAAALLAAGATTLARSPKLHRPRAPACMRGGCDGCLMRVSGQPNVTTCLVAARGGEEIVTQNVLGSRELDLLRATDWFFPRGLDHHHLLAGTPGLSRVMQAFARKVSGLGRLPDDVEAPKEASAESVDVLVVGAGLAGLAAARAVADRAPSCRVVVVDERPLAGGSFAGAPGVELPSTEGVEVWTESVAAGVFDDSVLVVRQGEARLVSPRVLVLATGSHDVTWVGPGNDLPGVLSARALCRLLALGVEPDGPLVVVGEGFFADWAAGAGRAAARASLDALESIVGRSAVKGAWLRGPGASRRKVPAVVVAIDAPGAPALELLGQLGDYGALGLDPAWDDATQRFVAPPHANGWSRGRLVVLLGGEAAGVEAVPDLLVRSGADAGTRASLLV